MRLLSVLAGIVAVLLAQCHAGSDTAEPDPVSYTNDQIANAIFIAEGGLNARYLYGIRSVKYKDIKDARQICLNTIRNNRRRFLQQNRYTEFLEFLGSRYCPPGLGGVNRNWLGNVRKILKQQTERRK